MLNKNTYICTVCGYDGLNEPPYDEKGCASFSICPCCGTEFGYDDHSLSHEALRKKWIESGMKWWSATTPKPTPFNPIVQVRRLML